MAIVAERLFVSLRDSQGRTAKTSMWVGVDTTVAGDFNTKRDALLTAIANCTNAAQQNWTLAPPQEVGYGTNAAYASAQDKMVLLFNDTIGTKLRVEIPAPKTTNFAADGITVINSGVAGALITQIIADCVSRDALGLLYLAGWFRRAKNLRRTSSLVKVPAGTSQAVP